MWVQSGHPQENPEHPYSGGQAVGGKPASPTDWPFIVALLTKQNLRQYCGGTLISKRYVLSAAHCLVPFKSSDIKVRVGEYDFDNPEANRASDFDVSEIINHKDYDRQTQENDIALVRMSDEVTYGQFVQPACLAPPGQDFANRQAYVIGWGTTSFGGSSSRVLREVQIPVWEQSDCITAYKDKVEPFPKMMCAGIRTGGRDSCQGDSGGPLLTQVGRSTSWYLIGVVSWGIECARPDRPGVYSRVNEYLQWIEDNTRL